MRGGLYLCCGAVELTGGLLSFPFPYVPHPFLASGYSAHCSCARGVFLLHSLSFTPSYFADQETARYLHSVLPEHSVEELEEALGRAEGDIDSRVAATVAALDR